MKKIALIAALIGLLRVASAGTTNVYEEDWGTTNGGSSVSTIGMVGWTAVMVTPGSSGPYLGVYQAAGANDAGTGAPLPVNTVYFSDLLPNQTSPALIYTTDTSGPGTAGDTSFTDINPTLYTNLTLSCEERNASTATTNYFAVRIGSSWYVCTSYQLTSAGNPGYPSFADATLIYTNPANVWQNLTLNSTSVTIGAVASPSLTSPITGIGIVELPNGEQPNYNELAVTALAASGGPPPTPPSIPQPADSPQNVFIGGGASFALTAAGTQPLGYIWESNGIPLPSGDRYLGLGTPTLTITNVNANDASITYSVLVTNAVGQTNQSSLTLSVNPVPNDVLYAELYPYPGPVSPGNNLPLSGAGWVVSAPASTSVGIYRAGPGLGDCFSYSGIATTNIYYTTDTNDVGLSGIPFVDINPSNYPAVSFQAGFVPGNVQGTTNGNLSVYWAVAMNGTWYCTAKAIPITITGLSPYLTNQYQFDPTATNWNNLTITGTNAIIGTQALSALTGNITGAGLVVAHNNTNGADMNWQNFEIVTDAVVGVPPFIGTNIPIAVTVASGGGASFGVAATGTQPFSYAWTTNTVLVQNGGRVSGATTATLTIADLTTNDNGMQVVAFVTNAAGTVESDTIYGTTPVTVTNPAVGVIYAEAFPFVGPLPGNYPITSVGWTEAVPNTPNVLFQTHNQSSLGAAFAYLGSAGTTVYYTTTTSDTNQAGLPFPNVDLAGYTDMTFAVDIAPNSSASNVTAYIAVQLAGTNWFVSANPLPVPTATDSTNYATYTMAFDSTAANWKNLTVTASGGLIGATAGSDLKGVMTGAGLVFVTVGSGGDFNFANFNITGTGAGGINIGQFVNRNTTLSWVGNPAVELQSTTNITSSWQDMPGTYGLYLLSVSNTTPRTFFRLKSP